MDVGVDCGGLGCCSLRQAGGWHAGWQVGAVPAGWAAASGSAACSSAPGVLHLLDGPNKPLLLRPAAPCTQRLRLHPVPAECHPQVATLCAAACSQAGVGAGSSSIALRHPAAAPSRAAVLTTLPSCSLVPLIVCLLLKGCLFSAHPGCNRRPETGGAWRARRGHRRPPKPLAKLPNTLKTGSRVPP